MKQINWKKNVALFLTGQNVSLFGSMLVQYAITWYITLKTASGLMMTISIICGFVPSLLLSPFAGVWADKYDRKKLIIFADGLIAFVTLVMAVLFFFGYKELWLLFAISVVRSFGQAVHSPAVGALTPDIVPRENLTKVNGIMTGVRSAMMILAPVLSGALLTFTSIEVFFLIDVITAAIAIFILISFVHIPKTHMETPHEEGYFANIKAGFRYIGKSSFYAPFFLYTGIFLFFVAPVAFLTPVQVVRNFGEAIWRLTAIEIVFSLGMMVGGFTIAGWGGLKNRIHTMAISTVLMGIGTVMLGVLAHSFIPYLAFMALIGIALPFYNTAAMVMIQEKTDKQYLGRVMSVMGMVETSMMPIGMVVFGPLADQFPIEGMLIGTGIVFVVLAIFLLSNKTLVHAGVRPEKVVAATPLIE